MARNLKRFNFLTKRTVAFAIGATTIAAIPVIHSDYKLGGFLPFWSRQEVNIKPSQIKTDSQKHGFRRDEVAKHDSKENGIWVTFENKVYDITEFVEVHPGGERILLAAGKAIDPFWAIFSIHLSAETRALLDQYYIGELLPKELDDSVVPLSESGLEKLFANEPIRDKSLKVLSDRPFNAEASMESLEAFITPNKDFYVRNHLPVPSIDEKDFRLEINVPGQDTKSLTLEDLKKLPKHTVMVALQCAGNRRKEMHEVKPVKGLQWQGGAISNAEWAGVRLADVLSYAGYTVPDLSTDVYPGEVEHVQLKGADGYGASVPASKVFNPRGDVLLAYEMNGEPIPKDHGYPLRAVISGHVAARSVKWLTDITLDSDESNAHWQQRDYKGFNPSKDLQSSDYSQSVSIQELPVQSSLITEKFEEVDGHVTLKGYAISGGGRSIIRVDVSTDGGQSWQDAELKQPNQAPDRTWAWTQWELKVPTNGCKELNIVCKAVDSGYNTQPDSFQGIYNVRGVLSSAWQRKNCTIQRP